MAMIAMIAAGLSSSLSSAGGAAFGGLAWLRRKKIFKKVVKLKPRRPKPSRFGRFRRPKFRRFRRPRFRRFRRPRFGRRRGRGRRRPRFRRRRRGGKTGRSRGRRIRRAIKRVIRRPKPKPKLTYAQQVAKAYGRKSKTFKRRSSPVRRIRRWRDMKRRRRGGGGGGGGGGGCFSAQTPIKLQNGDLIHMKDVELGNVLVNGSTVNAVMKIKIQNEPYYKIYSLNLDKHIYVTGTHYVKHGNDYVQVKNFPEAEITDTFDSVVYCLITDDHKIPIGEHVFWDWEDNLINV